MYCITDGRVYIKQNIKEKYIVVNNFNLADTWNSYNVAKAVLENSISKSLRKSMYIANCDNSEIRKCSFSKEEKKEQRDNKDGLSFELSLYSFENDTDLQAIISGFELIEPILQKSEQLCLALQQELIRLDYALEDLKHYQLRKKLGTVDSYKFKKIGDKILNRRTSVKNQLEVLHKINKYQPQFKSGAKDICDVINEVKNKKYVPRVLVDLFENDNLDVEIV